MPSMARRIVIALFLDDRMMKSNLCQSDEENMAMNYQKKVPFPY